VNVYEWLLILGMAGVTFGSRYLLFGLAGRIRMPAWAASSLQYVPPAVLTAITLPAVLLPQGKWYISPTNPYLIAALAAVGIGAFTKNLLATIAVGLVAFFGWRFLLASVS
jgi:branched-subunit amino acid transport protein